MAREIVHSVWNACKGFFRLRHKRLPRLSQPKAALIYDMAAERARSNYPNGINGTLPCSQRNPIHISLIATSNNVDSKTVRSDEAGLRDHSIRTTSSRYDSDHEQDGYSADDWTSEVFSSDDEDEDVLANSQADEGVYLSVFLK
nr:uncharacterized protein CTRU02_04045 [Colletotrichum truncatum]KAF6796085.1 hypothetical protein CTRU02_04045 [Colletotrichum truncatum]